MKTTIFSLLMACGVTAFGQFIPQPNAYNPDANGDSFIGVDDVMGTLALFGNAFDNGDSLQTLTLEFSQAGLDAGGQGSWVNKYELPEGIDVLFVHGVDLNDVFFTLPQGGQGFHCLLIVGTTDVTSQQGTDFKFYTPPTPAFVENFGEYPNELLQMRAQEWNGAWQALLRSPSGQWIRPHF